MSTMVSEARFALLTAREFNQMAKSQLSRLDEGHKAEVIVSLASVHTLALELYLKSFILIKYGRKAWGHDVLDLFDELEDDDSRGFEYLWQHYALGQWRESKEDSPGEIAVTIASAGVTHVYDREPWTISMRSTMERTKDRFKEWRYLFEKGEHALEGGILSFIHEFNSINSMNRMLDKSVEEELSKAS